jgi:aspartate beta-hydroxylase
MLAAPADDTKVVALVRAAEQARAAGQRSEAMKSLSEAQAMAPDHPLVLNAAGAQALLDGDYARARELLERAVAREPNHPSFWLNLASALRGLNARAEEMTALDRVLTIDPRHLLALLQKGSLLELAGQPRAAASVYRAALASVPRGSAINPQLREAFQRAMKAIAEDSAALDARLGERLAEARARWHGEPQGRVDRAVDLLLGKKRLYVAQPIQAYFPFLPAVEFHDRALFPWFEPLERASEEIRSELLGVMHDDRGALEPYINYAAHLPLDQWHELNQSRRWSAFFLWQEGKRYDENIARCPRTAELLAQVPPRFEVAHKGPTAFFSILDANTHIPAHTGVTNMRLTVHLPLVLPGRCRFRVGAETRDWRLGEAWAFDDTIEHEAWNDSEHPRAILIFDIWNPGLSAAERELMSIMLAAEAEFRSEA